MRHDFHYISYFLSSAESWTQGCWLTQGLKAVQSRELPLPTWDQERGVILGQLSHLVEVHGKAQAPDHSRAVLGMWLWRWVALGKVCLSCMMKGSRLWAGLLQSAGMELCLWQHVGCSGDTWAVAELSGIVKRQGKVSLKEKSQQQKKLLTVSLMCFEWLKNMVFLDSVSQICSWPDCCFYEAMLACVLFSCAWCAEGGKVVPVCSKGDKMGTTWLGPTQPCCIPRAPFCCQGFAG